MVETQNKQWKHKINGGKLHNNEEIVEDGCCPFKTCV